MTGMRLLLLTGTFFMLLGLAASWFAGSAMVKGEAQRVPSAFAPVRDFRIRSSDGLSLAATYWPGRTRRSPAILLLHGVKSSRASTAASAQWLAGLGYAVLTLDFRGHGQSQMAERSFGLREASDAEGGLRWLRLRQGGAKIAVIGHSLGGAAALLGPSGPIPADALVLQAVYPDIRHAIRNRIADRLGRYPAWLLEPLLSFQALPRFGVAPSAMSPLKPLRAFHHPVFIIGGLEDRYTPPAETRALYAAAPGPKRLWLIAGRGHAELGDLRDPEYRRRVADFLQRTIGPG